jgi:hypothetical protein
MPRDTEDDFQNRMVDLKPNGVLFPFVAAFFVVVVGGVLYLTFKFVFLPIFTQ